MGNKWIWITAIVLVPFLAVWFAFSLPWALGMLGTVAVLFFFVVLGTDSHTRKYTSYDAEPTGFGGRTESDSRFSTLHANVYDPAYSTFDSIDPEESLEDEENDEESEVRHVYEVRHIYEVRESDKDEKVNSRPRGPRRNLFGGPHPRDVEADRHRAVRGKLRDWDRTMRRLRRRP